MPDEQFELHDIHLPSEPGWFPLAPGWWILLALIVAGLVFFFVVLKNRKKQQRFQQESIGLIEKIILQHENKELSASDAVTSISAALKRIAITLHGREKVARLSGKAWLTFLDSTSKTTRFDTEKGQVIITAGYQAECNVSVADIAELARGWIKEQRL